MDKKTIIISLGIIILIGLCYFLIPKYNLSQKQEGFQIGYEQAIVNVMRSVATCEQVPITYNNFTLNLFAIECINDNN